MSQCRRRLVIVCIVWWLLICCAAPQVVDTDGSFHSIFNVTSTSSPADVTAVCYVYPRSLTTGLGVRFTFLLLQRYISSAIRAAFPESAVKAYTIGSESSPNSLELMQLVEGQITSKGCSVLVVTYPTTVLRAPRLLTELPLKYPNILFIVFDGYLAANPSALATAGLPNVHIAGLSYLSGWFAAGAAAAAQCRRCTAFVSPHRQATESANAFARGMRWAAENGYAASRGNQTSSCPLYHVFRSWDYPEREYDEGLIAELLLQKGCDIIATWTDSDIISRVVSQHSPSRSPWSYPSRGVRQVPVFSIVAFASLASVIDDGSVLVSVGFRLIVPLKQLISQFNATSPVPPFFFSGVSASFLTSFSSKVPRRTISAGAAAYNGQLANETMLCGGFRNTSGHWINNTAACITDAEMFTAYNTQLDYLYKPLDAFISPAVCPPGTEPRYNLTTFGLNCNPCGSNATSVGGGTACRACPNGSLSDSNRTACAHLGSESFSTWCIIGAVVASVALAAIFGGAAVLKCFSKRDNFGRGGPRGVRRLTSLGPEVGLVMIAVDAHRSPRSWRQDVPLASAVLDALEEYVVRACTAHNGYWAYHCADVHLVLTSSPLEAFRIAMDIEREFHSERHLPFHLDDASSGTTGASQNSETSHASTTSPICLKIHVDGVITVDKIQTSKHETVVTLSRHPPAASNGEGSKPRQVGVTLDVSAMKTELVVFQGKPLLDAAALMAITRYQGFSLMITPSAFFGVCEEDETKSVAAVFLAAMKGERRVQLLCMPPVRHHSSPNTMGCGSVSLQSSPSPTCSLQRADVTSPKCRSSRDAQWCTVEDLMVLSNTAAREGVGSSAFAKAFHNGGRTDVSMEQHPSIDSSVCSPIAGGAQHAPLHLMLIEDDPQSRSRQRGTQGQMMQCGRARVESSTILLRPAITEGVLDSITLGRFIILGADEVASLVLIASGLIDALFSRLDKKLVHLMMKIATARLQIRLERVMFQAAGGGTGVFPRQVISELICVEFLSAMDEQALREWLRSAAQLRAAYAF